MSRRQTKPKKLVLDLLKKSDSALNFEMVFSKLEQEVNRATIYRILNAFVEDDIVHKILNNDGVQHFAYCKICTPNAHNHNHFHFNCSTCGIMKCLDVNINIDIPESLTVYNYSGLITGLCGDCKNIT